MSRSVPLLTQEMLDQVGPDTLLRLDIAVRIAFPAGGMTVSGLRKERDRGRLVIVKMAGKDFTTLRDVERMRGLCRAQQKGPHIGLDPQRATRKGGLSQNHCGPVATERKKYPP